MKTIVVDTNIVFSTFLNSNSRIGQILINGYHFYRFIAPDYIRTELLKHQQRIKEIGGGVSDESFLETFQLVMKNINVVSHSLVPMEDYSFAEKICSEFDVDDVAFVALTRFSKGTLWTGDKALVKHLKKQRADFTISTDELYKAFILNRLKGKE